MKKLLCLTAFTMCFISNSNCQVSFPFTNVESQSSILAYWYNCKNDTVFYTGTNNKSTFNSSLEIYGPVVADSFYVKAEVFLPGNEKTYEKSFLVRKDLKNIEYSVTVRKDYFLLITPVSVLDENPEKMRITISTSENKIAEKWIDCKYHKLSGRMYDFRDNPLKAFIMIYPDGFNTACGVWSDTKGNYEIDLPERTYNAFYVNDGNYRSTTLEAWSWHMIMDNDQVLDYKIGTGEVYNLNVWPNNGGFSTYSLVFRPMVLEMDSKATSVHKMNDREFSCINIAPELATGDLKITINGEEAEIYSMQKYYETGKDKAMPAYLVQMRRLSPTFGKQTICVQYDKIIEKEGKMVLQNSMGYYQFFTNFLGYSDFN